MMSRLKYHHNALRLDKRLKAKEVSWRCAGALYSIEWNRKKKNGHPFEIYSLPDSQVSVSTCRLRTPSPPSEAKPK
ncbi:hypothetical protein DAPPUDRAFT_270399, partial [Daphnia pulex]